MPEVVQYSLPKHLAERRLARRRERLVQVVAGVLVLICFVSAGLLLDPMNQIRKEQQLLIDPTSVKGLPPDIALLGKLGTFRALAIDWAAIRGSRLQEEGKFYEAYELHQTVCRLQPRFPSAWVNASWNMAYNISVSQYTPEARWKWVNDGIKLLRDDGLRWNPRSVLLYRQLAWTYWHKIADYLDDEHYNYKRALAVEMESVLGPQPVALTTKEYFDWFRRIVEAPRDLDALLAEDEAVARVAFLLEQVDLPPGELLLRFVARNIRPELRVEDLLEKAPERDRNYHRRMEILTDPELAPARERLLAAVRSQVLRERYKFDLDYMMKLMEERYGPLDWRSPFAHALYWSSLGNELRKERAYQDPADVMNNARNILFSLRDLVGRGKLTLHPDFDNPFESYIEYAPDPRFISYAFATYYRLAAEVWGNDENWDPQVGIKGTSYWNGFVNSIENWIQTLYFEGGDQNLAQAEQYLLYLRDENPHPDGSTQERYTLTLDEFVMQGTLDQMSTFRQSTVIIRSLIFKSLKELSLGRTEQSLRALNRAKLCRDYWMADTTKDINERRKMPSLRELRRDAIEHFMTSNELAPYFKARLWHYLETEGRQMVWDRLWPYFTDLCATQDPPWNAAAAFPEPPGMDVYRSRPVEKHEEAADTAEQGERYKD